MSLSSPLDPDAHLSPDAPLCCRSDTYATDAASFQIINGPNMSGKSTLLRQIALLHVMAQIGSFVPAQYASFRPVSALLTRLSNDDNLEASLSTFASEMTTMSMILGTLKAHEGRTCLVIVDELGRGTSPDEGLGIAHAIAEEIIKAKVCRCVKTWPASAAGARLALSLSLSGSSRLGFVLLCHALQGALDHASKPLSERRAASLGDRGTLG